MGGGEALRKGSMTDISRKKKKVDDLKMKNF